MRRFVLATQLFLVVPVLSRMLLLSLLVVVVLLLVVLVLSPWVR